MSRQGERFDHGWGYEQNSTRREWSSNDVDGGRSNDNNNWQSRNGHYSGSDSYDYRQNGWNDGKSRSRDGHRGSGGGYPRENDHRHEQNYHQQQQHYGRNDRYDDQRGQPMHRGGVDLQQYTHHNGSEGDWETVPDRSNRQQSQRGVGSSWHDRQPHEQPNGRRHQHSSSSHQLPFMLILVGIPGSGKSTFATALESAAPSTYVRINQDTLGSRRKCEDAARRALQQNKCPIIDRCNFNPSQRQYFVDIAREYRVPVHVVSLEVPKQECIQRCQARHNHETIRPGEERSVVTKMMNMFEVPYTSEGFATVKRVSHDHDVNQVMQDYISYASGGR